MSGLHEPALSESRPTKPSICGTVCECGPNYEPLACGFKKGHDGPHAWATLPTFVRETGQSCGRTPDSGEMSGEPDNDLWLEHTHKRMATRSGIGLPDDRPLRLVSSDADGNVVWAGHEPTDSEVRAMNAVVHLQEAIRGGVTWDESHYAAVCELAAFVGGKRT